MVGSVLQFSNPRQHRAADTVNLAQNRRVDHSVIIPYLRPLSIRVELRRRVMSRWRAVSLEALADAAVCGHKYQERNDADHCENCSIDEHGLTAKVIPKQTGDDLAMS